MAAVKDLDLDPGLDLVDNSLLEDAANISSIDLDLSASEEADLSFNKSFEYDYVPVRIVRQECLLKEMNAEIQEAAELTCLPPSAVRVMLNAFKWDKAKMLEKTMYGESFLQLRDLGIIINPVEPVNYPIVPSVGMIKHCGGACLMCRKPIHVLNMVFTGCNHWFCIHCLQRYLLSEIRIGDRSHFKCPYALCMMLLEDNLISHYLPRPWDEVYQKLCINDFVNLNKFRRFCPSEGCNRSACYDVDLSTRFREVECECGICYCFGCGNLWHYPLSCDLVKKWRKLFKKIPEYEDFALFKFSSNAKPCPNCTTFHANLKGEERILCRTCDYKFCWTCMGKYSSQKHNCLFDTNEYLKRGIEPNLPYLAQIQADYVDLLDRFSNFDRSTRFLASPRYKSTPPKLLGIDEILDIIGKSQQLLRHTFVFAYFLENTLTKLDFMKMLFRFESVLVGMLGEDFTFEENPDMCANAYKLCNERDKLLQMLVEGFEKDLWKIRQVKWSFKTNEE